MIYSHPIAPRILRELLRYEPETGKLFWLPRAPAHFAHCKDADSTCRRFNSVFAGKEALFGNTGSHGYREGAIFDRQYLAHRVIWAVVHGEWPNGEIDHINGCRTDNRLTNLRCVPREVNMRNRKLNRHNKSGTAGVYWATHAGKWRAEIKGSGGRQHLGYFNDKAAAVAARKAAEPLNGFHPNHGRAA